MTYFIYFGSDSDHILELWSWAWICGVREQFCEAHNKNSINDAPG